MRMARFEAKYTENDFLNAINGGLKTTGYIAKKVGCVRSTAVLYLDKLKEAGRVEEISVDDGAMHVWKVSGEK
jgi:GTP-sensing pleiotropic transcriptional regulator CodY